MHHAIILAAIVMLTACNSSVPPAPTNMPVNVPAKVKVEGPEVKSLSYEQLSWYDNECLKYGNINDERVIYSAAYCRAVDIERNVKSLGHTSTYKVMKGYPKAH